MELKSEISWRHDEAGRGSNRTFMELKLNLKRGLPTATICSNRTFMELKLDTHIDALDVATF